LKIFRAVEFQPLGKKIMPGGGRQAASRGGMIFVIDACAEKLVSAFPAMVQREEQSSPPG
jgi:hypothetical protein